MWALLGGFESSDGELLAQVNPAELPADTPEDLEPVVADLEAGLGPLLPIACEARDVALLAEREDGTWAVHTRLPLGAG